MDRDTKFVRTGAKREYRKIEKSSGFLSKKMVKNYLSNSANRIFLFDWHSRKREKKREWDRKIGERTDKRGI